MRPIYESLGKVKLTCEGAWENKEYDELCVVYGDRASYISKRDVPKDISLDNLDYWQPIANLNQEFINEFEEYKNSIDELVDIFSKIARSSRLVVNTIEERDNLTYKDVIPGNEVYVFDLDISYVLRAISIPENIKIWVDSKVDNEKIIDYSITNNKIADNAVDARTIHDNSITTNKLVNSSITNEKIADKTITRDKIADNVLSGVYKYQYSVQLFSELPTDLENTESDRGKVYNVNEEHNGYPPGTDWAWTGTEWNALGGEMSNYYKKVEVYNKTEIDDKFEENKPVVSNDIPVTVDLGADYKEGNIIKAGTLLEDVITKLLSKELFVSVGSIGEQEKVTNITTPQTPVLSKSGTLEVGDSVILSPIGFGTSTVYRNIRVSGFKYGYKINNANHYETIYNYQQQGVLKSTEYQHITLKFTGFNGKSKIQSQSNIEEMELIVSLGNNRVENDELGPSYNISAYEPKTLYILSNLKNITDSNGNLNVYTTSSYEEKNYSAYGNEFSNTIVGKYRWFYGYIKSMLDYTTLFKSGESEVTISNSVINFVGDFSSFLQDGTYTIPTMTSTNDKSTHVIIVPADYQISEVYNEFGVNMNPIPYSVELTRTYTFNNRLTSYKVYIAHAASAITFKNIKITKI